MNCEISEAKLNYKRLGDYIQVVNIRNKNLEVETLLGVSIKKVLMPSIANTVGTDMSRYKIIEKKQFAYGPVTSRNGDKISIALLEEHDKALVSQAYTVFEIIDETLLNAEYLMMWFRRPEFDRYARYKSHGSARETFDWDEMQEVELPIPSIEKQNEIVAEYNTIVNRIKLNETLNQKLEDTAQALYKHWFVDFEFPNADGRPYKSSGGEMVYNEELDMDIPLGWEICSLYDTAIFINGASFKKEFFCSGNEGMAIIKIDELKNGISSKTTFTKQKLDEKYRIKKGELLYSWSGNPETSLETFKWLKKDAWLNQHIFKIVKEKDWQELKLVYYLLQNLKPTLIRLAKGKQTTGLGHVTVGDMKNIMIAYPSKVVLSNFIQYITPFYDLNTLKQNEIIVLNEKLSLLLSKMSKVETKTVVV